MKVLKMIIILIFTIVLCSVSAFAADKNLKPIIAVKASIELEEISIEDIEISWDETLFIGDSLTVGMDDTLNLSDKGATVIAKVGRSINEALDASLYTGGFKTVIISIGTNDVLNDDEMFKSDYQKLLKTIKENNPEAEIYADTLPPVSDGKAKLNGYRINNEEIDNKNEIIKSLVEDNELKCIDINSSLGYIDSDDTRDGLHYKDILYEKWFNVITDSLAKEKFEKTKRQLFLDKYMLYSFIKPNENNYNLPSLFSLNPNKISYFDKIV